MIRIGICDDEKLFLDSLECMVMEVLKDQKKTVIIHKFSSGIELLEEYDQEGDTFDIIILDINMPKVGGIETAKIIREKDEEVILIFLTSMEDKVYKTFKYNTFRFIRKYHIDKELKEALESAMEKLEDEKYIFTTTIGEIELHISEILYFEFYDRVVHIKTFNSEYRTNIRRFKDIEDIFSCKGFVIVYRGNMINKNHIKSIVNTEITLDNGEKMHVSRYRIEEVKKAFIMAARRG